jgi:hypothetical protein
MSSYGGKRNYRGETKRRKNRQKQMDIILSQDETSLTKSLHHFSVALLFE